jgi:hypothetical protein
MDVPMPRHSLYLFASIAVALLAPAATSHALINGSFEESYFSNGTTAQGTWNGIPLDQLNGTEWDVYKSIPGWTTASGAGIEIQSNTVVQAQSGSRYVELDSHPGPNSNTTMQQTVATVAGGSYQLDFYFHARPYMNGTSAASSVGGYSTNAIGVSFGNNSFSVDGSPSDGWVHVSQVFKAIGSSTVLSFGALGLAETYGGFIDSVSLKQVPELDPKQGGVALVLIAGGMLILGGRRRKLAV